MAPYSVTGLGIVVAGVFLAGCGAAWSVVTQASPDPFAGQTRFGVLPVDYSGVRVGGRSEGAYLADQDEKERSTYADAKIALEETFRRTLRAKAGKTGVDIVAAEDPAEAPFLIRPTVAFIQPGSGASRVEMDVKIVGAGGVVLDEIRVSHGSDTQVGGRLRLDGEALGALVADYVRSRVGRVDRGPVAESPAPAAAPPPDERDEARTEPVAASPEPAPPPAAPEVPRVEPPAPSPQPPPPPAAVAVARATRAGKAAAVVPRGKHPGPSAPRPLPAGTPIAGAPVFARLESGKSRVWVEIDRKVDVVESRVPGRVIYRLRGAAISEAVDQIALPTEFFTTPIQRVQLVQQGADVDLIVDLREEVSPTYQVVDTPRGIVLQIDLPRSVNFGRVEIPEPMPGPARRGRVPQTLGSAAPPQQPPPSHAHGRGSRTKSPTTSGAN